MIKAKNDIQETEPKTKAKRGRKPKAEVEVESTIEEDAKRVEVVETHKCSECEQKCVYIRRIKRLD